MKTVKRFNFEGLWASYKQDTVFRNSHVQSIGEKLWISCKIAHNKNIS